MNKYVFIFLFGLLLWIGESWYFGWNVHAISNVEKYFDVISSIFIFWGIAGDLTNGIVIIKQ